MKVLLLNGSPHINGCTFTALKEVADWLNRNDIDTEIMSIGTVKHGCIACGKCKELGHCVFDDDNVNTIAAKIREADGIVVGSPVYYSSPNGSLIAALDRIFYSSGRAFAHKPAAAVVSARRAGTTTALDDITKYFTIVEMPVVSSTYWTMVHGNTPEQVKQDTEGLATMRNLGINMAWLIKCIDAGKKAGVDVPINKK